MKKLKLIPFFLLMLIYSAFSQDADGCKDHELFSRMPGYYIPECLIKKDQVQVKMADGKEMPVDGTMIYLFYAPGKDVEQLPAFSDILKFYEGLVKKYKGEKVYSSSEQATLKVKSDAGKDIWISIRNWEVENGKGFYDFTLVEAN